MYKNKHVKLFNGGPFQNAQCAEWQLNQEKIFSIKAVPKLNLRKFKRAIFVNSVIYQNTIAIYVNSIAVILKLVGRVDTWHLA